MSTTTQEATMAPTITIRQATTADAFALRRLAALDDSAALQGDVLVAEEAGEIRAALSMDGGRVVANPFARTLDLVDMLRAQLRHVETVAA
jgi:hypothetical protein